MNKILFFTFLIFSVACANKKKVASTTASATPTPTPAEPVRLITDEPKQGATDFPVLTLKVLRISCASFVAQILSSEHKKLGEDWVPFNVRMKEPYKNVVNIINQCQLPVEKLKEGDEFTAVLLDDKTARNDCVVCMMADYPPTKTIMVKFLKNNK
jgi:hypothetical protein